jgi:hypothetical protein
VSDASLGQVQTVGNFIAQNPGGRSGGSDVSAELLQRYGYTGDGTSPAPQNSANTPPGKTGSGIQSGGGGGYAYPAWGLSGQGGNVASSQNVPQSSGASGYAQAAWQAVVSLSGAPNTGGSASVSGGAKAGAAVPTYAQSGGSSASNALLPLPDCSLQVHISTGNFVPKVCAFREVTGGRASDGSSGTAYLISMQDSAPTHVRTLDLYYIRSDKSGTYTAPVDFVGELIDASGNSHALQSGTLSLQMKSLRYAVSLDLVFAGSLRLSAVGPLEVREEAGH